MAGGDDDDHDDDKRKKGALKDGKKASSISWLKDLNEGYLYMSKGDAKSKKPSKWEKWWFVLEDTSLTYFAKKDLKKQIGSIDTGTIKSMKDCDDLSKKKKNVWQIVTESNEFYLYSESSKSRTRWVTAIQEKIDEKKNKTAAAAQKQQAALSSSPSSTSSIALTASTSTSAVPASAPTSTPAATTATTTTTTTTTTDRELSAGTTKPVDTRPSLFKAVALFDCEAEEETDLAFFEGDVLDIVDDSDPGWWEAGLDGVVGVIPANYVERLKEGDNPAEVFKAKVTALEGDDEEAVPTPREEKSDEESAVQQSTRESNDKHVTPESVAVPESKPESTTVTQEQLQHTEASPTPPIESATPVAEVKEAEPTLTPEVVAPVESPREEPKHVEEAPVHHEPEPEPEPVHKPEPEAQSEPESKSESESEPEPESEQPPPPTVPSPRELTQPPPPQHEEAPQPPPPEEQPHTPSQPEEVTPSQPTPTPTPTPTPAPQQEKITPPPESPRAESTSSASSTPISPERTTSSSNLTRGGKPGSPSHVVIALDNYEPSQPGELAFRKGDFIAVIERLENGTIRGKLNDRTGVFPGTLAQPAPSSVSAQKQGPKAKSSIVNGTPVKTKQEELNAVAQRTASLRDKWKKVESQVVETPPAPAPKPKPAAVPSVSGARNLFKGLESAEGGVRPPGVPRRDLGARPKVTRLLPSKPERASRIFSDAEAATQQQLLQQYLREQASTNASQSPSATNTTKASPAPELKVESTE